MPSEGPIVLITGITGFLAQTVLRATLDAPENYRVRGTVRSLAKSKELVYSALPNRSQQESRLELFEVADTATSDLSAALKDVDYVLHLASPYIVADVTDPKKQLLDPALEGTLNCLRYAAKSPSVKRVVITSSFAAVSDFPKGGPNRPGFTYTDADWMPFTAEDAIKQGGAIAYSVSKKLAEKAAWDFVKEQKPQFDVCTVNPPMIYGKTPKWLTAERLNTSSKAIYTLITSASEMPGDRLPLFCNAADVAAAQVHAIQKPAAGGHRFLLWGGSFNWAAACKHIAEKYPQLKDRLPKGWQDAEPKTEESYAKLDTSKARDILGLPSFKTWQETVDECIEDLLELEKKPDWK